MKKETKLMTTFWLISAIINFLAYFGALGFSSKIPYIWLLYSIIGFCMFIIYGVKLELERWKEK